jgi:hypothetical protein
MRRSSRAASSPGAPHAAAAAAHSFNGTIGRDNRAGLPQDFRILTLRPLDALIA